MSSLHHHYDQLTDNERKFVDEAMKSIFDLRKSQQSDFDLKMGDVIPPKLAGDDRAEQATDAIAKWVIESR